MSSVDFGVPDFIENGFVARVRACRGRILECLYIDNCLPLTVELFRQAVGRPFASGPKLRLLLVEAVEVRGAAALRGLKAGGGDIVAGPCRIARQSV